VRINQEDGHVCNDKALKLVRIREKASLRLCLSLETGMGKIRSAESAGWRYGMYSRSDYANQA